MATVFVGSIPLLDIFMANIYNSCIGTSTYKTEGPTYLCIARVARWFIFKPPKKHIWVYFKGPWSLK
jgi:hypothetical protein